MNRLFSSNTVATAALALLVSLSAQASGIADIGNRSVAPVTPNAIPAPKSAPAPRPATTIDGEIVTRFEYDELGNRIKMTDAEGRVTRWEYSWRGLETARTLPDGKRETKEYDPVGNLVAHTDFNGATTRYTYDVMDRVTLVDYPLSPDVSFTYTPMGLRDTATDGSGTTEFSYDRRDRLTGVQFPHGEAVAYSYDNKRNVTELVTANQRIRYTYDARDRLSSVTDDHGTTRFEYDQVGNRTGITRPNGVRSDYVYDSRYRLIGIAHTASTGALLFGATYAVNASGLRLSAIERDASGVARTIMYTYDGGNRLLAEAIAERDPTLSRTTEWTYDKVGNRKSQKLTVGSVTSTTEYTYDGNDRLLTESSSSQTTTYTYDNNGNTLTKSSLQAHVEYRYSDDNKLIEMRQGGERFTYTYDIDGLRIGQTHYPANGATISTFYLLDKNRPYAQVIEEHVQEGSGSRRLVATYTFGDDLISQTRSSVTQYVHNDGMNSTRLLTGANGAATDSFTFGAFGNELARTGTSIVGHLYRGEEFDPNLGFYNLRARFYDPKTGRFPTMDSFGGFSMDPPSLHKYLYANADPVNGSDPSGNTTLLELETALNIASVLGNMQLDLGQLLSNKISNPGDTNCSCDGWGYVASMLPFGTAAKWLTRGLTELRFGAGVVRFSAKFRPLEKEISAATLVAAKRGSRVFLRGKGVQGADALIDGVKWEIKTLQAGTNNAVANNIKKAVKSQSSRVIIDGRAVGLTEDVVRQGMARAARDGYSAQEVMVLLPGDEIVFF